jgi:hypothetical protein
VSAPQTAPGVGWAPAPKREEACDVRVLSTSLGRPPCGPGSCRVRRLCGVSVVGPPVAPAGEASWTTCLSTTGVVRGRVVGAGPADGTPFPVSRVQVPAGLSACRFERARLAASVGGQRERENRRSGHHQHSGPARRSMAAPWFPSALRPAALSDDETGRSRSGRTMVGNHRPYARGPCRQWSKIRDHTERTYATSVLR